MTSTALRPSLPGVENINHKPRHTCTVAQENIWEISALLDSLLGAQVQETSQCLASLNCAGGVL
jgi:hypothetical protein